MGHPRTSARTVADPSVAHSSGPGTGDGVDGAERRTGNADLPAGHHDDHADHHADHHGGPHDQDDHVARHVAPDEPRWREVRWALAGGAVAAGAMFAVAALVGRVSAFEARRLVGGIKPTATFAASTYIGAGATILALMATMIVFSITHESQFSAVFYRRLKIVAAATTALIVVAIVLLTTLVVPIAEADEPTTGYVVVYWSVLALGSLGGGLTVTIVLVLNDTVRGLIELGRSGNSHLVVTEEPGVADP